MPISWTHLNDQIEHCDLCPRLLSHCRRITKEKRKAYLGETYWGRPVPNFGDPQARLLIVGLAPAAHGANRTGRMFTGDRSGEWLYRALFRAGFANQAESANKGDGLILTDCAITAICHCAPPDNKPTSTEIDSCQKWLTLSFDLLPIRVVLALGQIAWTGAARELAQRGWLRARKSKFTHGGIQELTAGRWLVGSYHPSQQNTFTGRLTESMLDDVFRQAHQLIGA